jgi:putative peptidoglycan lipid II flippase
MTVAAWTAVSRASGLARAVAVAAVLGPTYLGNLFQATYVVPALLYQMLVGSLFVALLVPVLVRHADRRDLRAAQRVASGFVSVAAAVFAVVGALGVTCAPLVMRIFSLGVTNPAAAAEQRRAGLVLLALMMPQLVLFAVAGTGAAVMNAHGRFALAAGAPALENLGVMTVMGATAVLFGTGQSLRAVTTAQVAFMGLGATAAVGLHAGAQWWGAARVGVKLVPRAGWRDPEVRGVLRNSVPSFCIASLDSVRQMAVLPVANRVPGGVVAFQLAVNFASLPVALGAKPIATALLPQLARRARERAYVLLRDDFVRGTSLACFVTIPAVVTYGALAVPLSHAISYGEMATSAGTTAVAASLAAIAPGIVGDGAFYVAAHAFYAMQDVRAALRSMALRTAVSLAGIATAWRLSPGVAVLVALGLGLSAGNLTSALHLQRRFTARLPAGTERLAPSLARSVAASLVMVGPAYLVAVGIPSLLGGRFSALAGLGAACAVAGATFVGLHWLWRSPEVASVRDGLEIARRRVGHAGRGAPVAAPREPG